MIAWHINIFNQNGAHSRGGLVWLGEEQLIIECQSRLFPLPSSPLPNLKLNGRCHEIAMTFAQTQQKNPRLASVVNNLICLVWDQGVPVPQCQTIEWANFAAAAAAVEEQQQLW